MEFHELKLLRRQLQVEMGGIARPLRPLVGGGPPRLVYPVFATGARLGFQAHPLFIVGYVRARGFPAPLLPWVLFPGYSFPGYSFM